MRTEEILKRMERQAKRRKWCEILRRILRGGICLLGSVAIVIIGVPLMEIAMDNWGTRLWIEIAVCYFAILGLVAKVYGLEDARND